MQRTLTPTLAIILAAGLATGIALARPGSSDDGAVAAGTPVATEADADRDDGYRPSGRSGGDAEPAPAAQPDAVAVSIEGFAFDGPSSVAPGTPLTVTNLDSAPHTLTFRSASVDTGTLGQGESITVLAPTEPGTYDFFCEIHPSMEGQIVIAG